MAWWLENLTMLGYCIIALRQWRNPWSILNVLHLQRLNNTFKEGDLNEYYLGGQSTRHWFETFTDTFSVWTSVGWVCVTVKSQLHPHRSQLPTTWGERKRSEFRFVKIVWFVGHRENFWVSNLHMWKQTNLDEFIGLKKPYWNIIKRYKC